MTKGIIQEITNKYIYTYRSPTNIFVKHSSNEVLEMLEHIQQELIREIQLNTWNTKQNEKYFCHCLRCIIPMIPIGKLIGDNKQ